MVDLDPDPLPNESRFHQLTSILDISGSGLKYVFHK